MKRELVILVVLLSICGICAADGGSSDATADAQGSGDESSVITSADTQTSAVSDGVPASSGAYADTKVKTGGRTSVVSTYGTGISSSKATKTPSATIERSNSGATSGTMAGSINGYATGRNSVAVGSSAGKTGTGAVAGSSAAAGGKGTSAATNTNTNVNTNVRVRVR